MKINLSALLGTIVSVAMAVTANAKPTADKFKIVHTDELAQWMEKAPDTVHIFDANNDDTRSKEGVIPGAMPLATSSGYDLAKTLPTDKNSKLVFYCANTQCMASHDAAKRAANAGYKDVNVMADGIQGWKKAGKPTETFKAKI